METLDTNILKDNIWRLIKELGITQSEFANSIGIPQPTCSKNLNKNNKNCFTIDQLYTISKTYNVSIDSLVGNSHNSTNTQCISLREFCSYLVMLIKYDILSLEKIEVEEDTKFIPHTEPLYMNPYDDYPTGEETIYTQVLGTKSQYHSLYFSNFGSVQTDDCPNIGCPIAVITELGNDNIFNQYVNNFLDSYIEIFKLYVKGNINQIVYDNMEEALLNNLTDFYYDLRLTHQANNTQRDNIFWNCK